LFHDLCESLIDSLTRNGSSGLALGGTDSLETVIILIGCSNGSLLRGFRSRSGRGGSFGGLFETFGILERKKTKE
jgi:hypothetical protein